MYTAAVMRPESVDVVLVRPWRAPNVAATCRAMKNMGLSRLVIVDPPEGLERPEARALAYGAWDVLDGAVTAATLSDAVRACTLVVGTSARPAADTWTPRRLAAEAGTRAAPGRLALVFGPESTGLRKDELALCHVRVHIPSHASQPSLNLAQAVLVLAYELFVSETEAPPPSDVPRATAGEIEDALADLREALLGVGYLNPDNPDLLLAELRAMIVRAAPTPREVLLLRGMARQVQWAARVARGGGSSG
jgi:TrmH family RNA methyltransferase